MDKRYEAQVELDSLEKFTEVFAKFCKGFFVIFLEGDLGSGKTTFSKALIKHLGVSDEVSSPTFSIENQYIAKSNELLVRHVDLYRGVSLDHKYEILSPSNSYTDEILIIEWANLLEIKKFNADIRIRFEFCLVEQQFDSKLRKLEITAEKNVLEAIEAFFLEK